MKNTYVKIIDKLPSEEVRLYAYIHKHAGDLAINFLVVGAMVRDLVLVYGFGSKIERSTRGWEELHGEPDS